MSLVWRQADYLHHWHCQSFLFKIKSNVPGTVRAFGCHNGSFYVFSNSHCRTLEEKVFVKVPIQKSKMN